jgi:hypothetical protein
LQQAAGRRKFQDDLNFLKWKRNFWGGDSGEKINLKKCKSIQADAQCRQHKNTGG